MRLIFYLNHLPLSAATTLKEAKTALIAGYTYVAEKQGMYYSGDQNASENFSVKRRTTGKGLSVTFMLILPKV